MTGTVHLAVMIDRYHLLLAATALVAGIALVVVDRSAPSFRRRTLGVAALVSAVLGGWGIVRSPPWIVVAALVALMSDRSDRVHPLGRWTPALATISLVGIWSAVPDTEPPLAGALVLAPVAIMMASRHRMIGPTSTLALVVTVLGAAWTGSAGWGAALATGCVVGMVGIAPVVCGFREQAQTGRSLWVMAGAHGAAALVLPRIIMDLPVSSAVAVATGTLVVLASIAHLALRSSALPEA